MAGADMTGGLQDRDAARRMANGNRELTRHFKDEFAKAAEDVAAKARRKILAAETKHPGPLREEIAGTVSVRGRSTMSGFSAVIKSDGEKMPPGKQNLGAYANAGKRRWQRWRHPVYGPTAKRPDPPWVQQDWASARGWFDQTVQDNAGQFSDAVKAAIDETQRYLEGR